MADLRQGEREQGGSAQAARQVLCARDPTPAGGIGRDDAGHAGFDGGVDCLVQLFWLHVWRQFYEHWHALFCSEHGLEDALERGNHLKCSQTRGVWRANVDRQVVRQAVQATGHLDVVQMGFFSWGGLVFTKIHPNGNVGPMALGLEAFEPPGDYFHAVAWEAHAVDDGLVRGEAVHAWAGVTGLREGGYGPYLYKAKTKLVPDT